MNRQLKLEIADTDQLRSQGLMYRKKIGKNEGMLFVFPKKDYLRFWMQSTYIPLDLAFFDDNAKIFQIESLIPLSTKMVKSNKECLVAVVVNKGWFSQNGIAVNSVVSNLLNFANKNLYLLKHADVIENDNLVISLNDKSKVKYAEKNNFSMQIVYRSIQSGQVLPPRKINPIAGLGYPIGYSSGGEYFTAIDVSPFIGGAGWEIKSNQIKRFLFSNIIALEILYN